MVHLINTSVRSDRYRITADTVTPGAVIIAVATCVGQDGKLHGDIDFGRHQGGGVLYHSPFLAGVGPATVATLIENVVRNSLPASGSVAMTSRDKVSA
jgi:methylenetetrahydrofolate dehydrogenase (NADP+) / methenyltetrahydrofolate cyclohydrolase